MCWNSPVTAFCLCDVGALELQPYARRRGLALTHPLRLRAANAPTSRLDSAPAGFAWPVSRL